MRRSAPVRIAFALLAIAISAPLRAAAAQEPQAVSDEIIAVKADRVAYFSNAATIQARGHVSVHLPDGASIAGDAFSMDLALQRFLVAGHVRLRTPAGDYNGAAFADFLPFRRMYFVPLDPTADRWTFLNGDYVNPEKGRVMPGDAFYLEDLSAEQPYIVAKGADIDPVAYVKFHPAGFVFLNGAVHTPPVAPYIYNFSSNPNFGVNALSGASFDAPYNFAGSAQSLDALHLRYDQQRRVRTFFSFEHHSVFGDGGYVVFSINPMTQPSKQWNLYAYDRLDERSGLTLEGQLFTYQYGLSKPLAAGAFADLQFVHALAHSSARWELTTVYGTLLAPSDCTLAPPDLVSCPELNHPVIAGLTWSGFDRHVGRTGLTYRLQSGIGYAHDVHGVSGFALQDVWSGFLGASLYTPVYPGPFKSGLNAIYQIQRTWLTFPNTVDQQTLILSDSRRLSDKLVLLASLLTQDASTTNPAATIASPNMSTGLTPQPQSPNGLPVIGGVAAPLAAVTGHAYLLTAAYAPSPAFQSALTLQQNNYWPEQTPGVAGPPRYQLGASLRTRITRTLFLTLGRAYNFNWAGQTWSPQFTLQVTPQ